MLEALRIAAVWQSLFAAGGVAEFAGLGAVGLVGGVDGVDHRLGSGLRAPVDGAVLEALRIAAVWQSLLGRGREAQSAGRPAERQVTLANRTDHRLGAGIGRPEDRAILEALDVAAGDGPFGGGREAQPAGGPVHGQIGVENATHHWLGVMLGSPVDVTALEALLVAAGDSPFGRGREAQPAGRSGQLLVGGVDAANHRMHPGRALVDVTAASIALTASTGDVEGGVPRNAQHAVLGTQLLPKADDRIIESADRRGDVQQSRATGIAAASHRTGSGTEHGVDPGGIQLRVGRQHQGNGGAHHGCAEAGAVGPGIALGARTRCALVAGGVDAITRCRDVHPASSIGPAGDIAATIGGGDRDNPGADRGGLDQSGATRVAGRRHHDRIVCHRIVDGVL